MIIQPNEPRSSIAEHYKKNHRKILHECWPGFLQLVLYSIPALCRFTILSLVLIWLVLPMVVERLELKKLTLWIGVDIMGSGIAIIDWLIVIYVPHGHIDFFCNWHSVIVTVPFFVSEQTYKIRWESINSLTSPPVLLYIFYTFRFQIEMEQFMINNEWSPLVYSCSMHIHTKINTQVTVKYKHYSSILDLCGNQCKHSYHLSICFYFTVVNTASRSREQGFMHT